MTEPSTELVVPAQLLNVATGELLDATPESAAVVLDAAREMKRKVDVVIRDASAWLAEESKVQGTKTFHVGSGTISLSGGPETTYDAHALEEALREAGCPEARIRLVVKEEISYKVDRRVLKQMVSANPAYREAAEAAKIETDKPFRAEVKTKGAL